MKKNRSVIPVGRLQLKYGYGFVELVEQPLFNLGDLFASSASVPGAETPVNDVKDNIFVRMSDAGRKPDVDAARRNVHS